MLVLLAALPLRVPAAEEAAAPDPIAAYALLTVEFQHVDTGRSWRLGYHADEASEPYFSASFHGVDDRGQVQDAAAEFDDDEAVAAMLIELAQVFRRHGEAGELPARGFPERGWLARLSCIATGRTEADLQGWCLVGQDLAQVPPLLRRFLKVTMERAEE